MEFKRLRYFVTVVEEGSISAAARKLYMSQPPLSTQLRLLEEELGAPLLERGARSVRLTEAGRRLYERARTLLELEQITREELRAGAFPAGGMLRLGVVSSVAGTRLPGWLSAFSHRFPGVQFRLVEANTFRLLEQLRQGHIPLAILRTPCSDDGLVRLPLTEEQLVAVATEGRLPEAVDLAALSKEPLLLYRRWEAYLQECFEREGLSLVPRCVCDDARTAVQLAAAGMGVAIAPASAVPEGMSASVVSQTFSSGIQVVYRPETVLPPCARAFLEYLEKEVAHRAEI